MDFVAQPSADTVAALGPAALEPLQADPTGGGIFALVVTFLLASLFYAVTLHLAATFFIGDVPSQRAAYVGPVPALVSILLGRYGVEGIGPVPAGLTFLVALVLTLVADAIAISVSYRISWRPTAILTALHLAFSVAIIIPLNNIFGFV
ncbi:DUF7473 family protein [Halosimplex marinum]|uniref:DUF7473 family protein n=1 Tax=Halosimplex marinum TaxID=3396620 RepID=UPI003F55BA43